MANNPTTKAPIRVFDTALNQLAEVDAYDSAYFQQDLSGYGGFEIRINWNILDAGGYRYASYFQRGYFVLFGDDLAKNGIILETEKKIDEGGKGSQILTVKGSQSKGIFNRRIVEPPANVANYSETGYAETVMKNLVKSQAGSTASANRQISLINITTDQARGATVAYSSRYKNLAEDLGALSIQTAMGFNLALNLSTKKLDFDVIPGLDRRASQTTNPRVIISTDYDTLRYGSIKDSEIVYKNIIYSAGQGVGSERNIRKVYDTTEPTGLERREQFEDMRDLSTNAEIDARGASVLQAADVTKFIDAAALSYTQYVLGTDYNLGDLITVDVYDETIDAQITSIKESWAVGSYNIEMSYNRKYPEFPRAMAVQGQSTSQALNNSEPMPSATVTVTDNYSVLANDKIVLVNTDLAKTITIPAGCPVGREITIERVSSGLTTNAVTVAITTDTIDGGSSIAIFGGTYAKTTKYSETFTFRKVTSSTWEIVEGQDAGYNSTYGFWEKRPDGVMECWYVSTTLSTTNGANGALYMSGIETFTYPQTFIAEPTVAPAPRRSFGTVWSAIQSSTGSTTQCAMQLVGTQNTYQGYNGYRAIGRWK